VDRYTQVVERIKGPVVPINICFDQNDAIDYAAVKKYVNWLCEQKVPILLLTYGSSEFWNMTDEELWRLTAEVAEANAGRSLFIASTGWWPIGKCREFLKHAERIGADAVKVQIHSSIGRKPRATVGYFDAVQDASPIPLLLWNCPPSVIPVDIIAELARRPQIVGMKNDGDQFYDYYDQIRATAGCGFAVISGGQMRNIALGYQLGSPAYLCTIAPFQPAPALAFFHLLEAHRYDDAWKTVFRCEEAWLKTAVELDWLPSIKSALEVYGLYPNNRLRAPSISHTPEQRDKVRRCLESIFGPIEPAQL
jgi:dihydrodipicolinate synthase/N-acetylneuraminate lyase